jgi:hypothetical protein
MSAPTTHTIKDTPGVLARFDTDWAEKFASCLSDYGCLGRMTGADLLARVNDAKGDYQATDTLLHALLTLAGPERHEAALYALVQIFRPLILSKAHYIKMREYSTGDSSPWTQNINAAIFWDVVMTYPLHRSTHVAGNLRGDMLKTICRFYPTPEVTELPTEFPERLATSGAHDEDRGAFTANGYGSDNAADLEAVMAVLDWARSHQVLTREETKLVGTYFTISDRAARQQMAKSMEMTTEQLSRRVSRCTVALRDALAQAGLTREAVAA